MPRSTVFLHYLYICLPVSCNSLQTNGQCSSESSLEGSPNCFSPLSLHLSPSCNKWLVLQKRFFGGFPQLFFSTFVPQSPTRPECCVNSRHLPFLDTSTLRRCWGILWAYLFFDCCTTYHPASTASPLCFASFPQVVYASQWLVKRRASLLTSTTAGDSTSRM